MVVEVVNMLKVEVRAIKGVQPTVTNSFLLQTQDEKLAESVLIGMGEVIARVNPNTIFIINVPALRFLRTVRYWPDRTEVKWTDDYRLVNEPFQPV